MWRISRMLGYIPEKHQTSSRKQIQGCIHYHINPPTNFQPRELCLGIAPGLMSPSMSAAPPRSQSGRGCRASGNKCDLIFCWISLNSTSTVSFPLLCRALWHWPGWQFCTSPRAKAGTGDGACWVRKTDWVQVLRVWAVTNTLAASWVQRWLITAQHHGEAGCNWSMWNVRNRYSEIYWEIHRRSIFPHHYLRAHGSSSSEWLLVSFQQCQD